MLIQESVHKSFTHSSPKLETIQVSFNKWLIKQTMVHSYCETLFSNILFIYSFYSWQKDGETMGKKIDFIFLHSKITADADCSHEIKRCLLLRRKAMTNLDSILKSRDMTLPKIGPSRKNYGFSSSHVLMWELDDKESWALKNWWFWTVVLEKTLESPLDFKEISPEYSLEGLMLKFKL